MLIPARYATVCKACKRKINPGERVSWERGKPTLHAACSDEGKAVLAQREKSAGLGLVTRNVDGAVATVVDPELKAKIPCPEGREFLPYQLAGIAFALERPGTLIADEMGLGKTVQAIGFVNAKKEIRKVLVICPASLKVNWVNEWNRWTSRNMSVVVFGNEHEDLLYPDGQVTVINYDILKKLPPQDWDLVILDEAQYVKNGEAKRTKLVHKICKRARYKLLLTGTPILNKPVELWSLLQIAAPAAWDKAGLKRGVMVGDGEGARFFSFAKKYCDAQEIYIGRKKVWDFSGASNLDELQDKLRATCMVRRLKADVLKELPPKRRQIVLLDSPVGGDEFAAFEEMGVSYEDAARGLVGKGVMFTKLSKARHDTALAKVPAALEHIRTVLESTEKVVIFAHHRDVIEALEDGLRDYNPMTITGSTVTEWRQEAVDRFQNRAECRVIIGSIGAMGVGLTLTAASTVIFVELSWVPAELTQAEDRCHRIGQKESVLVQHLIAQRSVDANMVRTVIAKQDVADMALDDVTIEDVSGREVIEVPEAPEVDDERRRAALYRLRFLASVCDGAHELDGRGFNANDTSIGKELARAESLTPKQTLFAERLLAKYHRQLERFDPS